MPKQARRPARNTAIRSKVAYVGNAQETRSLAPVLLGDYCRASAGQSMPAGSSSTSSRGSLTNAWASRQPLQHALLKFSIVSRCGRPGPTRASSSVSAGERRPARARHASVAFDELPSIQVAWKSGVLVNVADAGQRAPLEIECSSRITRP